MKTLAFLKPGDTIGVCAPSAQFDIQKLDAGIIELKELGFKVKVPEGIFQKKRYLAGPDSLRAAVLNQLFSDPQINAIICARGGFGAMRMLEYVDWDIIKKYPKPLIGFSDATALLLSIMERSDVPVVHGPNLTCLSTASKQTVDSFYQTLIGSAGKISIEDAQVIFPGKCSGVLKGGNMATISHLVGTQFVPDFKQSIVFFEETKEPAYKIDRMLTQMKMSGLFKGINGVITGSFNDCANENYITQILFETFEEYDIPVLRGLNAGHGSTNLSLPMGLLVEMDTQFLTLLWNKSVWE